MCFIWTSIACCQPSLLLLQLCISSSVFWMKNCQVWLLTICAHKSFFVALTVVVLLDASSKVPIDLNTQHFKHFQCKQMTGETNFLLEILSKQCCNNYFAAIQQQVVVTLAKGGIWGDWGMGPCQMCNKCLTKQPIRFAKHVWQKSQQATNELLLIILCHKCGQQVQQLEQQSFWWMLFWIEHMHPLIRFLQFGVELWSLFGAAMLVVLHARRVGSFKQWSPRFFVWPGRAAKLILLGMSGNHLFSFNI